MTVSPAGAGVSSDFLESSACLFTSSFGTARADTGVAAAGGTVRGRGETIGAADGCAEVVAERAANGTVKAGFDWGTVDGAEDLEDGAAGDVTPDCAREDTGKIAGRGPGLRASKAGLSGASYPIRGPGPTVGVEGVEVELHLVPVPATNLGGTEMAGVCGAETSGLILVGGAGVEMAGSL